jgi:glycosyltransferase involved in cell wall biosynthesis
MTRPSAPQRPGESEPAAPGHAAGVGSLYGVLVTHRRPMELAVTLSRISQQDCRLKALVLVDNAPAPETRTIVRGFEKEGWTVYYLPAPENLGPAGGIALGMARVLEIADDDDWIVLLDDDDPPLAPTWFGELLDAARAWVAEDPRTAGVGFGGARFHWLRARLVRPVFEEYRPPMPVDYFASGLVPMYRVGAIRDVGTFSAHLFFGLDDLEFCLRLRQAGYALYGLPPPRDLIRRERSSLKVKRKIGRRFRLDHIEWRSYYSLRNLIYILRMAGHPSVAIRITVARGLLKPIVNSVLSPTLGWKQLHLNWRACRDAWTGRMGRTLEPGDV